MEKLNKTTDIVGRATFHIEEALRIIKERSLSYNGNGINYEDYKLNSIDSIVEDLLETVVRLWTCGDPDKAADGIVIMSLLVTFIEMGCPQSRFSQIFHQFVPRLWAAVKENDTGATEYERLRFGSFVEPIPTPKYEARQKGKL